MLADASPRPKVRCREIAADDLSAIVALLTRGFPGRPESHWRRGLDRQRTRDVPDGAPRFGFMLESGGAAVGVLLLIYSERQVDGAPALRCNLSSWYVEPDFRTFAAQLTSVGQRNRAVTFFNLSPAPVTWPIVEAQGFRAYATGLFFALPVLSGGWGIRVEAVGPDGPDVPGLPPADLALLRRHAGYGCLAAVAHGPDGPEPFVFRDFRARSGKIPLPAVQLVYARDETSFRRSAGALGRFLVRRGRPVVILSATGPLPGLPGLYTERRGRKYVRGPHPPGLWDLTDSEYVLFGL